MKTMCWFSCHDLNLRGSGIQGEAVKERRKIYLFHVFRGAKDQGQRAFWNHMYRQPCCLKQEVTHQLEFGEITGRILLQWPLWNQPMRTCLPWSTTNLLTAEDKSSNTPGANSSFTMLSANLGLISEHHIKFVPQKGCTHEIGLLTMDSVWPLNQRLKITVSIISRNENSAREL